MFFQTFDDKHQCVLAFQNGRFFDKLDNLDLSHTWSYANYLKDMDIEYAQLWAQGAKLAQACPSNLKEELDATEKKLKAIIRSCYEAGVDLNELCFYEFTPPSLLEGYANIKNKVCDHIFNNHEKPSNYDHLLKVVKVVAAIKNQPLHLDLNQMNRVSVRDRNVTRSLKECNGKIVYDAFKTKTGRLTTTVGSFPILTLAKEYRTVVKPHNEWLYELDFNAAELRTILGLLGHMQPQEDLHEWNINNLFSKGMDREAAKKNIFAWLYNPAKRDDKINAIYDREKVKELHYADMKVQTPYNRTIECDDYHAVNYLIQSTAADVFI